MTIASSPQDAESTATGRCGPLKGIRVIDASRVLAGPFCGTQLADLGADVIRVEHPAGQDEVRLWAPLRHGVSAPFNAVNHSKRSVALDITKPDGAKLFNRLLSTADVLIENFRPGTLERLNLGWKDLHALHPRLIHCSIRAFPTGTTKQSMPGYEASMQAESGVMSLTGEDGRDPVRCGPSVIDLTTGLVSTIAVLSALRERDRSGQGQYVEPALLRTAAALMCYQIAGFSLSGDVPERHGSGHPALVPYRIFHCKDGPVFIAAGNNKLWAKLCDVLVIRDDNGAVPYSTLTERTAGREEVDALVEGGTRAYNRAELLARLGEAGVPAAAVNTLDEMVNEPSMLPAGVIGQLEVPELGDLKTAGALFASDYIRLRRTAAPGIGQHTDEVLKSYGLSESELADLRSTQTIK